MRVDGKYSYNSPHALSTSLSGILRSARTHFQLSEKYKLRKRLNTVHHRFANITPFDSGPRLDAGWENVNTIDIQGEEFY